jgi:hypothetical protein
MGIALLGFAACAYAAVVLLLYVVLEVRWRIVLPLALAAAIATFVALAANAHDVDGRFAASPLRAWVSHLRAPNGMSCCEDADGHRVDDVDWRGEADGSYSVRIDRVWMTVDRDKIITEPNRLGFAMVWIWNGHITCFLPGPGT